jgi:hypothetical protein
MGNKRARAMMVSPSSKGVEVADVDKNNAVTVIPNEIEMERTNTKGEER